MEEEFAVWPALIRARVAADMTQAQVAEAMGTKQSSVSRLETGQIYPSTYTLSLFAKATGSRLRIIFERGSARE